MKQALDSDSTVIDFGGHFYPPKLEGELPDGKGERDLDEIVGLDRMFDPETVIDELEAAGVDGMTFTVNSYLRHDDVEETAEANDAALEIVEEYEEFFALAALPVEGGVEASAAEFERSVDAGLQGGALEENEVKLTDREMEPVLEVADQTGAPLFVHVPNLPSIGYRHNATLGREMAQQKSITRVIHEGIYDRYPNLNIVWHHLGGNVSAMMGRIQLWLDNGRWPSDKYEKGEWKEFPEFKRDFEERVYIDSCGFYGYSGPIRTALEELPPSQVLFGTDFPWEPRDADEFARLRAAISESTTRSGADRVLGQNALDLMVNAE